MPRTSLAFPMMLCIAASLARAEAPATAEAAPAGDDAAAAAATRPAIGERDVIAEYVAFENRFVVDAYKSHGHRDARWDADAVRFLTAFAHDQVATTLYYESKPIMPVAQRIEFARRIAASGCDDAIVLYEIGHVLETAGDRLTAAELYGRADAAAPTSPYVAVLRLRIARADDGSHDEAGIARGGFVAPPLTTRLRALLCDALADRETLPAFRRTVWGFCAPFVDEKDPSRLMTIADSVTSMTGGDPWMLHTFMGRVALIQAAAARGAGPESELTPERRRAFVDRLTAARDQFRRAIDVDDSLPQPFSFLIDVAMLDGSKTSRGWFDLAIARQFDYVPAYYDYVASLRPGRGGSTAELLRFGNDAVDGRRFDTAVPSVALIVADAIDADAGAGGADVDRLANDVYPLVARCLDGYIQENDSPRTRFDARCLRAAWAARLGKWDEAQAQFVALAAARQTPDARPFAKFRIDLAAAQRRAAASAAK